MKDRSSQTPWPFSIFGSQAATAKALRKSPTTVQYWADNNRIPQAHWDAFIKAAADVGVTVTAAELHNMAPQDEATAA